ncbi:MAG: prohibitin family protein [Candidatus Dadabacteria bacterium]|nr:prohibitin family protein [Candidatus Dadabacteria bacterium]MCY4262144.1 prohibitin family protein [Candidatus Dadabacteria bacterium]
MRVRGQLPKLNIFYPIIFIMLFFLVTGVFVIVESGHVGVVRTLGAVQPKALAEGFHLKKPLMDKIEQIDIRLTAATAKAVSASKDLQTVKTQVTLQYSITGDLAPLIYQKIGKRNTVSLTLIEPAIQESVKAITAKYTAEQLVTKRAEVKVEIQEAINNFISITLVEKEISTSAVKIANVAITDFDFSDEFNRAIELKVKAEQEALQAKNEKIRRVTQAEAAAEEKKLAASAQAFEIEVGSKARADAIERESKALRSNPKIIQLRLAEKWDGTLPKFSGGGTVPLLNVDSLLKEE